MSLSLHPTIPLRHTLWPLVRASIDKDNVTVILSTGEPDDLDGIAVTCVGAAEALALAQFINKQGCPPSVLGLAADGRRTRYE